ncbi:PXPV repeat protein [Ramlibacter alkalitolerans]|uniref:PXPV repeat protein n=1 Tax=Ramlibacter alkalitolerans TaxID=2039631 RepID=A0ABS1JUK0_9BURK|nr:PXPV repeat protein [Ramlibacter alkalitolerans]MBL0427546.1 PXPV repeat protein [Ramlibacter alkalitolerans]
MNRLLSSKTFLAAAVAFGSLAAVSAAHARTDLAVSIGVPLAHVHAAPVYVQPQPVYEQPQPVYVQPRPVYVQPQPVYYRSRHDVRGGHDRRDLWGDADRDGISNVYDRDWRHYDPRAAHQAAMQSRPGDADGDGVPNRLDRAPHNPTRR